MRIPLIYQNSTPSLVFAYYFISVVRRPYGYSQVCTEEQSQCGPYTSHSRLQPLKQTSILGYMRRCQIKYLTSQPDLSMNPPSMVPNPDPVFANAHANNTLSAQSQSAAQCLPNGLVAHSAQLEIDMQLRGLTQAGRHRKLHELPAIELLAIVDMADDVVVVECGRVDVLDVQRCRSDRRGEQELGRCRPQMQYGFTDEAWAVVASGCIWCVWIIGTIGISRRVQAWCGNN